MCLPSRKEGQHDTLSKILTQYIVKMVNSLTGFQAQKGEPKPYFCCGLPGKGCKPPSMIMTSLYPPDTWISGVLRQLIRKPQSTGLLLSTVKWHLLGG